MPVSRARSWSVPLRSNQGQASVEVLIVALGLLAIVVIPVTADEQTMIALIEAVVQSWMWLFGSTWQYFLLHPWAS